MENSVLISLVDSVLGSGKNTARNNRAYKCPFPDCAHSTKQKLEINFTTNEKGENLWGCWVCGAKGKKIYNLFKKLKVDSNKIDQLRFIIKSTPKSYNKEITEIKDVVLPKEFISLYNTNKPTLPARRALVYLKNRGITENDIIKYNIGYCEQGEYSNMIIIPSYDKDGKLNYFVSRNFDKNSTLKYKNPNVSRDIIAFEFFINWNVPIILCEGAFDAIAIKRNAIPLLGKNIQKKLMKEILQSNVEKIYIALDMDAQKQALQFCEKLINEGKEVYLVEMNDKDPSEMGFHKFTELIQQTQPLTFSNLFEKKLQLI